MRFTVGNRGLGGAGTEGVQEGYHESVPAVFEFGGATSQGRWVLVSLVYRMALAVGMGVWVSSWDLHSIRIHLEWWCIERSHCLRNDSGNRCAERFGCDTFLCDTFLCDTFFLFLSGEAACARSFDIFTSCAQEFWCWLRGPGVSQCALHGSTQEYRGFIASRLWLR
jgi:hypothetical protein